MSRVKASYQSGLTLDGDLKLIKAAGNSPVLKMQDGGGVFLTIQKLVGLSTEIVASGGNINIKPNGDADDYFTMATAANVCYLGRDDDTDLLKLEANSFSVQGVIKTNSTQVVGAQGAAVADATGAGDVVAQLNTLLARLRTHGLIAT